MHDHMRLYTFIQNMFVQSSYVAIQLATCHLVQILLLYML